MSNSLTGTHGRDCLTQKIKHRLLSIGTAVLAIDSVILIHLAAREVVGENAPLLLMLAGVAFCAWRVGLASGLLATLFGAVVADLVFFEPKFSFKINNAKDIFDIAVFTLLGILSSAAMDALNRLRKKAEIQRKSALDREKQLKDMLNSVSNFVGIANPRGELIYANDYTLKTVGCSLEEICGDSLADAPWFENYPDEKRKMENAIAKARRGQTVRCDIKIESSKGELIDVDFSLTPMFNEKYEITYLVPSGTDITDRKQREEERKANEERFQLALHGSGTFVAMIDRDLRYTWGHNFDRAYPELANDIVGKRDNEIFAPDQAQPLIKLKECVLSSGVEARQTLSFYQDEKRRDFDVRVQPTMNQNGEVTGLAMAANDVTVIKEAEIAAESASQAKTLFLANMSHEIRTPIGIMIGYAELLKDAALAPDENKRYLETIIQNGEQLSRIINEILDVSKVESEKIEIEKVDFSLTGLLAETFSVMAFEAQEKGLKFHYIPDLDDDIDHVISDPTRLRQILFNIIGNAIKFTSHGSITVRVRSDLNSLDIKRNLIFDICDTGLGISSEQRDRLFKPFAQADGSMTRRFGGTGLGLYLSKRLSEALGGTLELMPQMHEGSHFQIRVPVKLSSTTSKLIAKIKSGDMRLDGVKVLLVEDSADNRHLISRYLMRAGAEVTTAPDGQRGVEAAKNFSFDVILMDLQMPVLDGYEALRILRELKYVKPILALTAHAFTTERERCLRSGFDEHLVKPIDRDELISTIQQYAPKSLLRVEGVPEPIAQQIEC